MSNHSFTQLLEALAETTHVLTVAARCGDRTLAERTWHDARAIHGELFTNGAEWRRPPDGR